MSLTDRLAAARGRATRDPDLPPAPGAAAGTPTTVPATTVAPLGRRGQAQVAPAPKSDPFQDLKRIVHQRLVEALGPKLYDAHMTQSELEQQVRLALQTAIADTDTPMSSADRTRISQEIADDILGYGPIEPLLRDSSLSEVMVNSFQDIYVERSGKLVQVGHVVHRRGPPAPHHRQDRQQDRPPRRRDEPDGATPACPTAAVSTRSSRRSRSTAPSSPSASSPRTPTRSTTSSTSAP